MLIVEDDALVLMTLQDMLADLGCTVVGVAMALAPALQLARSLAMDIAILDVNLNDESVVPAAQVLAERRIPFAFASGYGAGFEEFDAFADRPRITKPYSQQQLMVAMLQALTA